MRGSVASGKSRITLQNQQMIFFTKHNPSGTQARVSGDSKPRGRHQSTHKSSLHLFHHDRHTAGSPAPAGTRPYGGSCPARSTEPPEKTRPRGGHHRGETVLRATEGEVENQNLLANADENAAEAGEERSVQRKRCKNRAYTAV